MKRRVYWPLILIISVCVFFSLTGCKHDKESFAYVDMDFEIISTNETLGILLDLRVKGDTLLTNQFSGDKFLNWFSLKDGSLIKSEISRGTAYKEMLGPLMINMIGDSLLIYDRQKFCLYKSDFLCDTIIKSVKDLPFWATGVFSLNDGSNIISKIPFGTEDAECGETRFAVLLNDSVTSHFGSYPEYTASDRMSNVEQKAFFHQTLGICELPNGRFLAVSSHILSLYSVNDTGFDVIKEIVASPYEYTTTPATATISATATLESGYDRGFLRQPVFHDGKIYIPYKNDKGINIYCYDTDLNLIGIIIPSLPILTPFAIDDDGRIVALVEEENSTNISISKISVEDIW